MRRRTPADLAARAREMGVRDERLLAAMRRVPRAAFVPAHSEAYHDRPIPIGHDQTTTQPSLTAQMIEALELTGRERILEIGTGFGYQTALLAALALDVWSIERFPALADTAGRNLAGQRVRNVHVVVGDGTRGLPDAAPFDAMLVSAAFPDVPRPLAEQLVEGGRLVQPIGGAGSDSVVLFRKREGALEVHRHITGARFVRLIGEHGFGN